jgi:hypothetical protein
MAVASDRVLGTGQASIYASHNHLAFKLAEDPERAEHGPAGGCGRVDGLGMNVEPRAGVADDLEDLDEVFELASEAIG